MARAVRPAACRHPNADPNIVVQDIDAAPARPSTCRTIDRRALPAGMLSRRIDAIAKITGRNAGRRSRRSCGLAQCRNPVKKPIYRGSRFGNFRMCEVVHTLGGIELLTSAMRRSFFHRTASSAAHLSGSLLTKSKTWHIHYLGFQRWAASERIPLGNLFCNLRFADVRAPNRYTKRNGARCFADDRRYPARERGLPVDWSGWIHFR
jgi:hypothetical protein